MNNDNIDYMTACIKVSLNDNGSRILITSPVVLDRFNFHKMNGYRHETIKHGNACSFGITPFNMMDVTQQLYLIHHDGDNVYKVEFNDDAKKVLSENVRKIPKPYAYFDKTSSKVLCILPGTYMWLEIARKSNMTRIDNTTRRIPMQKIRDFLALNDMLPKPFQITVNNDVRELVHHSIPEPYDGSDESLRSIDLNVLDYVQADVQPWDMRKAKNIPMIDKLHNVGYHNLHDLIVKPPYRYIDRSNPIDIRDLVDGERATIIGTVVEVKQQSERLWVVNVQDSRGKILSCSFFNGKFVTRLYHEGDNVIVNGVYKPFIDWSGNEHPQMQHPTIDFNDVDTMPVIPMYHQSGKNGVSSTMIMNCERELVDRLGDFKGPEWLQNAYMTADLTDENGNALPKEGRMSYGEALKTMHCPGNMNALSKASDSLAFSELVQMMTIIEDSRRGLKPVQGVAMQPTGVLTDAYINCLKYDLTGAQKRVLKDIDSRLRADTPMHALLVGDVGSGKTTVIHMAALKAVESGYQAVICAPTEILATQLYDVFMGIVSRMPADAQNMIHPILHTNYKGKGTAARKRANISAIKDGSANVVFGTHSVFSDKLDWFNLGFVGIDEQHKFGAEQRSKLLSVRSDGRVPDMLMQTATPIPRSIAQMYYGDIAYMRLDELPAGRLPITTQWVKMKGKQLLEDSTHDIWHDIEGEANMGHGTFIICPMVEDSPKTAAASVKNTYQIVRNIMGLSANVGIVYGTQDPEEQAKMIDDFRKGAIQILVASSVVEVGVSCEEATRMVILDANRFGLASLHQIRGRIGRGNLPSTCYLVASAYTPDAEKRMIAMTETLDGWRLSQKDLKNRGSGTLFGESQSGGSDFMFADLIANGRWIGEARRVALEVLQSKDAEEALSDSRKWFQLTDNDSILS